jgi:hypothetical protein
MAARALLTLLAVSALACPGETDERRRCDESRECPVLDCGAGVHLQYCHQNYCESDPEVACDAVPTSTSGSGGGAGS